MKSIHWYRSFLVTLMSGIHPDDWEESFSLLENACKNNLDATPSQVWKAVEQELEELRDKKEGRTISSDSPEYPSNRHNDTSHQNPYANIDPDEEEKLEQEAKKKAKVVVEFSESGDPTAKIEGPLEHTVIELESSDLKEKEEKVEQPKAIRKPSMKERIQMKKNLKSGAKIIELEKRIPMKTKEQKAKKKKEWDPDKKMSFKNENR